jgi:hypothetical protein
VVRGHLQCSDMASILDWPPTFPDCIVGRSASTVGGLLSLLEWMQSWLPTRTRKHARMNAHTKPSFNNL